MRRLAILGTRGIPANYGGFETFAEQIACRLAARGFEITVFCEARDHCNLANYKGVKLEYVPSRNLGPFTTLLFDLICLWRARRGFDVVYMLGYGASVFCWIPRFFGSELWINMDGLEWARSKWSSVARYWLRVTERVALLVSNRIIADADGIVDSLLHRYDRIPCYSMIPYGADVVTDPPPSIFLRELELDSFEYYLVVCRFEPENHVVEIVEGYLASGSKFPLVLVGNLRAGGAYVAQLRELQCDRVRFIGTVYDQEKLMALRFFCRAYLHGHSVGGTNPSLLEALGCGNPVLAHDNMFNREVAADAGIYFDSAASLTALIDSVEADVSRLDGMRVEARTIILHRYTWEHIVDQYEKLLIATVQRA